MSTDKPQKTELHAMTVAHGRKIFNECKAIEKQLEELKQQLGGLEEGAPENQSNPVDRIIEILESLVIQGQTRDIVLQEVDAKLDALLSASAIGGP